MYSQLESAENNSKRLKSTNQESNGRIETSAQDSTQCESNPSIELRSNSSNLSIHAFLEFYSLVNVLKHLPRQGWVNHKVPSVESVASHMYRMTLMAMTAPRCKLGDDIDIGHCMKMCLVHDLGESIVGDITPNCLVTNEEKFNQELMAIQKICSLVHDSTTAEMIMNLWLEYEKQETPNAKFVKELDRFDMIIQAHEYENKFPGLKLDSFWKSTEGKFRNPFVKEIDLHIREERKKRLETKKE